MLLFGQLSHGDKKSHQEAAEKLLVTMKLDFQFKSVLNDLINSGAPTDYEVLSIARRTKNDQKNPELMRKGMHLGLQRVKKHQAELERMVENARQNKPKSSSDSEDDSTGRVFFDEQSVFLFNFGSMAISPVVTLYVVLSARVTLRH